MIMCGRDRFVNLDKIDTIHFHEAPDDSGLYGVTMYYSSGWHQTYYLDEEEYEVICRSLYNVVIGGK